MAIVTRRFLRGQKENIMDFMQRAFAEAGMLGQYIDTVDFNLKVKEPGMLPSKIDPGEISDGYHTFNELYEHRNMLFIFFLNWIFRMDEMTPYWTWKSKTHSDGTSIEGWFVAGFYSILGTDKDGKGTQISYHLPMKYWDLVICDETHKPEFDGHTSQDVIDRLSKVI